MQGLLGMSKPGMHASWVDGEQQCYWRADAGYVIANYELKIHDRDADISHDLSVSQRTRANIGIRGICTPTVTNSCMHPYTRTIRAIELTQQ